MQNARTYKENIAKTVIYKSFTSVEKGTIAPTGKWSTTPEIHITKFAI